MPQQYAHASGTVGDEGPKKRTTVKLLYSLPQRYLLGAARYVKFAIWFLLGRVDEFDQARSGCEDYDRPEFAALS